MFKFVAFVALASVATASYVAPVAGPVVRAAEYVAPVSTIVRAPQYDSARFEHKRYGGNFAYHVAEAPAYAKINPVIRKETVVSGVSYTPQAPIVTKTLIPQPAQVVRNYETVQPAPVVTKQVVAQPAYVQKTVVAKSAPAYVAGPSYGAYAAAPAYGAYAAGPAYTTGLAYGRAAYAGPIYGGAYGAGYAY